MEEAVIKYREVECPYCNHRFMWADIYSEGSSEIEYYDKETRKYTPKAKCPKCAEHMIVVEGSISGFSNSDERYISSVIRGF